MTGSMTDRHTPRMMAFVIWLALSCALIYMFRREIGNLDLADTDDALRLVQIRDWMAGQSWFDVTQHRVNPPHGGVMHWSRLIDVPIAALIALFQPLFGAVTGEKIALTLYPLLLIGGMMAMIARFAARMGDRDVAVAALVTFATSSFALNQMVPLRIDHHGPQILIAFAILFPLMARPSVRSGTAAGALFALYLSISFEGLPYLAMVGAIFAFDYLRGRDTGARLAAFAATFALGSPAILAATRGWAALWQLWCDSWSAPYWLAVAAAVAVLITGMALIAKRRGGLLTKLVVMAAAGAAGALVFVLRGEPCLAGPFAALDPLVRDTWYANVAEGQGVMKQSRTFTIHLIVPTLVGIIATLYAWRRDPDVARRGRWGIMLLMLLGAAAVALMVGRAISVAHIYAIPGIAFAMITTLRFARARPRLVPRAMLTLVPFFMAPTTNTLATDVTVTAVMGEPKTPTKRLGGLRKCLKRDAFGPILKMPPTHIFAQVDLSPHLLLHSRNTVIATPHHRNSAAMATIYRAFMAAPGDAEAIIRATGTTHLLFCADSGESSQMIRRGPKGLAAVLRDGKGPAWLVPVYRAPRSKLVLYRIMPAQKSSPRR